MDALANFYGTIHSPLALILCISAIGGHCFAIAILSRKVTPTNIFLASMSCLQLILTANYLYVTIFKYFAETRCMSIFWSYPLTVVFLVSVNLSVLVHMAGVFHVVALSIVRYLSLKELANMENRIWFTKEKCIKFLITIYVSTVFICGPLYFHSEIQKSTTPDESCVERYPQLHDVPAYHLAYSSNEQLARVNFYWFGSFCKITPCFVLFVMTFLILKQLKTIREMSARFHNNVREKQHNRTTQIILAIMVVFIVVELPQGILTVAQGIVDVTILDELNDFFEMLTLLTSCIIFGLLLTMNAGLREAFVQVFARCWIKLTPGGCCTKSPDSSKERLFKRTVSESRRLMGNGITTGTSETTFG